MDIRDHERNQQGRRQVAENGVGCDVRRAASQFAGDDGRGCGHRTDKTYHRPFENNPRPTLWYSHGYSAEPQKHTRLKREQPPVPPAQFQMSWIDLAESDEKHCENQKRLHHFHRGKRLRVDGIEERYADKKKITSDTCQNGENQNPVSDESCNSLYCTHFLKETFSAAKLQKISHDRQKKRVLKLTLRHPRESD